MAAVGLSARVHLQAGRACALRPRAAAAQPRPRRCATVAMASPFDDKKKEAAKRALMSALEGKGDVLKENADKEAAARLKAAQGGGGGGGGRGGSGGGGGRGGGDDGKWKKETGTTLQTFAFIVGGVRRKTRAKLLQARLRRAPPVSARSLCCSTPGASFSP